MSPGGEEGGTGKAAPKVPAGSIQVPRALPAEAVPVNQVAIPRDLQILNQTGEAKLLGCFVPRVPPGEPDVSPEEARAGLQVNLYPLVVAAPFERDGRPRQDNQHRVLFNIHPPLLGGKAAPAGMDTGGGLAHHNGTGAGPHGQLDELGIAIHQASRRIEDVDEVRLVRAEITCRQDPQRHLLVAMTKDGPACGLHQLQTEAADPARSAGGKRVALQLRGSQKIRGRDSNCWWTHWMSASTPAPVRRLRR